MAPSSGGASSKMPILFIGIGWHYFEHDPTGYSVDILEEPKHCDDYFDLNLPCFGLDDSIFLDCTTTPPPPPPPTTTTTGWPTTSKGSPTTEWAVMTIPLVYRCCNAAALAVQSVGNSLERHVSETLHFKQHLYRVDKRLELAWEMNVERSEQMQGWFSRELESAANGAITCTMKMSKDNVQEGNILVLCAASGPMVVYTVKSTYTSLSPNEQPTITAKAGLENSTLTLLDRRLGFEAGNTPSPRCTYNNLYATDTTVRKILARTASTLFRLASILFRLASIVIRETPDVNGQGWVEISNSLYLNDAPLLDSGERARGGGAAAARHGQGRRGRQGHRVWSDAAVVGGAEQVRGGGAAKFSKEDIEAYTIINGSQFQTPKPLVGEEQMAKDPIFVDLDTRTWFLEDPTFIRWLDSDQGNLLWLSADPGCGKSVLSRTLITSLPSFEIVQWHVKAMNVGKVSDRSIHFLEGQAQSVPTNDTSTFRTCQQSIVTSDAIDYLFPPFKMVRHRARIRARWCYQTGGTPLGGQTKTTQCMKQAATIKSG